MDGPYYTPIESGVLRRITLRGAERYPAALGLGIAVMLFFMAIYGTWEALYGLPLVLLWHGIWALAARRDPQYSEVLWRQMVTYPWPARLDTAPGVFAKRVKVEPSVPVKG